MPPRRALSKAKPTTADDLAAQLADRLTIKEPTVTRKDQQPPLTKMSAMKAINDISQTLSQTVKSGWKASGSEPKKQTTTLAQVRTLVSRAERALDYLRNADGVVSLDVERAAASLVSKLVHLELVRTTVLVRLSYSPRCVARPSFEEPVGDKGSNRSVVSDQPGR